MRTKRSTKAKRIFHSERTANLTFIGILILIWIMRHSSTKELNQQLYSCILTLIAILALVFNFGHSLFDEVRSVKNHPHEHVYARIRGVWYDFAQFDHPG